MQDFGYICLSLVTVVLNQAFYSESFSTFSSLRFGKLFTKFSLFRNVSFFKCLFTIRLVLSAGARRRGVRIAQAQARWRRPACPRPARGPLSMHLPPAHVTSSTPSVFHLEHFLRYFASTPLLLLRDTVTMKHY